MPSILLGILLSWTVLGAESITLFAAYIKIHAHWFSFSIDTQYKSLFQFFFFKKKSEL